ncbi:MAG: hypothetical protein ACLSB9_20740 [Hydrogeniiclostridium mannosilyticum]
MELTPLPYRKGELHCDAGMLSGRVIPASGPGGSNSHTGYAMLNFPATPGPASDQCWLIKVKAVTGIHRKPVLAPARSMCPWQVSHRSQYLDMVDKAMPGRLQGVYCASAGGGKFMAVLQFKKSVPSDEGRQRQAALLAFSAFRLKHIFLVDEDVDPFDMSNMPVGLEHGFRGCRYPYHPGAVSSGSFQRSRLLSFHSGPALPARLCLTVPPPLIRRSSSTSPFPGCGPGPLGASLRRV